jgi:hypothetical protein
MKYRKKPVVIEAELFDRDKKHRLSDEFRTAICNCVSSGADDIGMTEDERRAFQVRQGWHIHTLEGPLHVSDGDMIIKGVKGEFYPCKPDIFEATYERVEA